MIKQEMARVNIDILGVSELKWMAMGKFNSDDHSIYFCRQESLRKNGVALIVNKRVQNSVLGCNFRNIRMILVHFQGRLQQYMNHEIPDVQAVFRKGRRTRDQIANIFGSSRKQESSRKTPISALLTMPKPLTVWITINCGKF